MKLIVSKRFHAELRREYLFLRERNPAAATAVRERIFSAVQRLKEFPESGRAWRLPGCRELVIPGLPYIIIYQVTADAVILAALFHSARAIRRIH